VLGTLWAFSSAKVLDLLPRACFQRFTLVLSGSEQMPVYESIITMVDIFKVLIEHDSPSGTIHIWLDYHKGCIFVLF